MQYNYILVDESYSLERAPDGICDLAYEIPGGLSIDAYPPDIFEFVRMAIAARG